MRTTSRTLIIVRGFPGSGKSTLALDLSRNVREADQYPGLYTYHEDGSVQFHGMETVDGSLMIEHAHKWCQSKVREDLNRVCHSPVVVVANTFVAGWEFTPYLEMAAEANARIVVIDCYDAGMTDAELAQSNRHGVPEAAIARMRQNWDHDWRAAQDRNPMPPWLRNEE